MAKKRTKTDFTEMDEHIRVLRELVAQGWADLKARADAEGKPLSIAPPKHS